MTVSRQRAWQLRKLAAGLCSQCGKEPVFRSEKCRTHYAAYRFRRPETLADAARPHALVPRWRDHQPFCGVCFRHVYRQAGVGEWRHSRTKSRLLVPAAPAPAVRPEEPPE